MARSHRTFGKAAVVSTATIGAVAALCTPAAFAAPDSDWDRLAECESGGNWSINTGNGYYGGLQFHPQTWAGFGGHEFAANAHLATREQQIVIAERVLASQGWRAWPACSAKLGLTASATLRDSVADVTSGSSTAETATATTSAAAATTTEAAAEATTTKVTSSSNNKSAVASVETVAPSTTSAPATTTSTPAPATTTSTPAATTTQSAPATTTEVAEVTTEAVEPTTEATEVAEATTLTLQDDYSATVSGVALTRLQDLFDTTDELLAAVQERLAFFGLEVPQFILDQYHAAKGDLEAFIASNEEFFNYLLTPQGASN